MAAGTPYRGPKLANLFFGHHYGVKPAPADVVAESSNLANGIPDTVEQLAVLVHQVGSAVVPSSLLVADHGQHHVAGQGDPFGFGSQEGQQHHDNAAFHVQGSSPPYVAVHQFPLKGRVLPGLIRGGHHVDMTKE